MDELHQWQARAAAAKELPRPGCNKRTRLAIEEDFGFLDDIDKLNHELAVAGGKEHNDKPRPRVEENFDFLEEELCPLADSSDDDSRSDDDSAEDLTTDPTFQTPADCKNKKLRRRPNTQPPVNKALASSCCSPCGPKKSAKNNLFKEPTAKKCNSDCGCGSDDELEGKGDCANCNSDDEDDDEDQGDNSEDEAYHDPHEYFFSKPCDAPAGPTKSHKSKRLAPGRVDRNEDISTQHWSVVACGQELPGHVTVSNDKTHESLCVPKSRAKKTMELLDEDNIAAVMHRTLSKCHCTRECYDSMNRKEIVRFRKTIAGLANEEAVMDYLVKNISRDDGLKVKGETVCRGYYASLHNVGQHKIDKANSVAKMGGEALYGRAPPLVPREAKKNMHATSFWSIWFDEFCQKPNEDVRLFPANQSYKTIYKTHFMPWFLHTKLPNSEKPGYSTWQQARYAPQFKDVRRRAKHFHCRCTVCATLTKQAMTAFADQRSLAFWQRERRLHNDSIRAWRQLEDHLNGLSLQTPEDVCVLSYDDTKFMSFPRLTNRPIKAQGHAGFRVVPWLLTNHGTGKQDYVYMPKGKWKKGANRLITLLHATVSAIKSDVNHPQHKARRLICIADNFGENKNKEILAWIADLVLNKWFDSVELLFGEVGHTHNGNDATHKVRIHCIIV